MARVNGVQYATVETKRCPMSDDGCAARVIEHLTAKYAPGTDVAAIVEKACGRFSRGKHPGKLRGWASIEVCTEGGWRRLGPGERNGYVMRPGTIGRVAIEDFNGRPYLEVA
jgi:hypothetical protein